MGSASGRTGVDLGRLEELVIGTRGSELAVRQAAWVAARLRELRPDCNARLKRIVTYGDRDRHTSIVKLGRAGVFTGELEEALRNGEVMVAVHSMKDLPSVMEPDLMIAAIPTRIDARDAFVSRGGERLAELAPGRVVGTSSLRRTSLLRHLRPDLEVVNLRGNLETRLSKVRDGTVDAAILAAAGLLRLGREHEISESLEPARFVPAVGQGALAVQTRAADHGLSEALAVLRDTGADAEVRAERAFLARLEGGCQVPLGAHGVFSEESGTVELTGFAGSLDGTRIVRDRDQGPAAEPEELGRRLAERLIEAGAQEIIAEARREVENA